MIPMPFPCKITQAYTSEVNLTMITFEAAVRDAISVNPTSIGEVREVIWTGLDYENLKGLEFWLMSSKATQRFTWSNETYLLEDKYTVEVANNKPIVRAQFRRVA